MELVGRYSNPDKWGHLSCTIQAISTPEVGIEARDQVAVHTPHPLRPWPVADRIGEQAVRDLVRDRQAGAPKQMLAERYGISLSSVKRVLRRYGCA